MSFRRSLLIVVVYYCLNCFNFGDFRPSQGPRLDDNVCQNCKVAGGTGFACDPYDCNCYVTCALRRIEKMAEYASPWVSYLRCCPSHTTFSIKLLTCVDYTHTASDCFNKDLRNNPCSQESDGTLISSQNPESADISSNDSLCNGFLKCEQVGDIVVPNPSCCKSDECFSEQAQACESSFCTGSCADLRESDCDRDTTPDKTSDKTPEPTSKCPYLGMKGSITQFMGVNNVKMYECAPGTCWDQHTCACVTNNTHNNDCLPKAELDFDDGDYTARDKRGNTIWTKVYGNVDIVNDKASFVGSGYIGVEGLSDTYLSKEFILHFEYSMADIEKGETECLVGSCLDKCTKDNGTDTIAITLDSEREGIYIVNIGLTYEDSKLLLPGAETTETVHLELSAEIEPGLEHDFWLFYGWEEEVYAGIFNEGILLDADVDDIEGSVQLVPPQSGFLFGHCQKGSDFNGTMDEIEMWTGCKPMEIMYLRELMEKSQTN